MNKIWHLSTCDTCRRIIKELDIKENKLFEFQDMEQSKILNLQNTNNKLFEFQDIKKNNILKEDLEDIQKSTNLSYEELFNKRAQKYSKTDLKTKLKTDKDFKLAILNEYTFLKRPIILIDNKYFVGNSKSEIENAKQQLNKN